MSQDQMGGLLRKGDAARYMRAAGLDRAIEQLAGPFGVRRFILFFEARAKTVRLMHLAAESLPWGGGPPPPDTRGDRLRELEAAATRMHRNMYTGPQWSRCAMAYTRDVEGRARIFPSFGPAADRASLDNLPMPGPPGHPLEAPETLRGLAHWEGPLEEVRARTMVVSADWDDWEIKDDTSLILHYPNEAQPYDQVRRLRCLVLATYAPQWSRFMWQVQPPLFEEVAFTTSSFSASWDAVAELCLLATARLKASWMFAQPIDDQGKMLLAAVWH